MIAELEALVAHLYIVGGRIVGVTPPGALAQVAPKRAARTHQDETLFTLLVPDGEKAPANTYQQLAERFADLYFKTSGSVTHGLRESLTQLNKYLMDTHPMMRVGLLCVVQKENEIYLARCGNLFAAHCHNNTMQTFPTNRSGSTAVPPLGVQSDPRLELTRFDILPGTLLLLADASLANVPNEGLQAALIQAADISDTLAPLRRLIDVDFGHATVIQFVTSDAPTPIAANLPSRARPEPEPVATPEPEPETPTKSPRSASASAKAAAKTLIGAADVVSNLGDRILPSDADPEEDRRWPLLSNLVVLLALIVPLVIVIAVIGLAINDPAGDTRFEECRLEALDLESAAQVLQPNPDDPFDAEKAELAREQWREVREKAFECQEYNPGDEEMRFIAGIAQNNLDFFNGVTRRTVTPLRSFEPGADLRGPISGNWIDLYTLDRRNDALYRDTLSTNGQVLLSVETDPIIQSGQLIRDHTVGDLVDLEWMERGGLPEGVNNVIMTLDDTGALMWYDSFDQADVFSLVRPPNWSRPIAMTTWRLNLYILDVGAQQIWRYVPNQGVYSDLPQEYFSGEERPNLSNAVDFGIDEDGNIFVLFADGSIQKFFGAVQQSFDYFNVPNDRLTAGSSLYVDNNPLSRGLSIADPDTDTLYSMSLGGTLLTSYNPLNDFDAFDDISGSLVNPETNSIYVLSDNILYHISVFE